MLVKDKPVNQMAVKEPEMYLIPQTSDEQFALKNPTPTAYVDSAILAPNQFDSFNHLYTNGDEESLYDNICYDDIITEDDEPVDNIPSEKTQRLAARSLFVSDHLQKPFVAMANVGLHYRPKMPAIVPDIMLTLDTQVADGDEIWDKENRTYYMWKHGKPPNVVVEIVSNNKGNEAGEKFETYAQIGVQYYVILDYNHHVQQETLVVYELMDDAYVARSDYLLEDINLSLGLWHGSFEDLTLDWLRWYTLDGEMLLTGEEGKELERQRADHEQRRADHEQQRADHAETLVGQERQLLEEERRRTEEERRRADAMEAQMAKMVALLQAQGIDTAQLSDTLKNSN
ncbi:MAG: Uma2 family endonuclease [Chloroflexota bacterium]